MFPCPNILRDCPCDNFPVRNFSSENLDHPVEFCTVTVAARVGTSFSSPCTRTCERPKPPGEPFEDDCSELSDTAICAQSEAQDCQNHDPDPPNHWRTTYLNHEQTCVVECPDGTTFAWTVPAGVIASAWQSDADARAYALACKRATAHRLCFNTDSPLTPLCVGVFASLPILAQGGTAPYQFSLMSGILPAGMVFDSVGLISGTPVLVETQTFTVMVEDAIGSMQFKEYVLRVAQITTASPLPSGTVGTAYNQALAAGGTSGTVLWALSAGTLPAGLSLSTAGVISGTPTESGTFTPTISFLDGGGASCQKEFELEIVAPVGLQAYWAFEAKSGGGNNFIADETGNGHPIAGAAGLPTIVAGKVANALNNASNILQVTGSLLGPTLADGITVAGWFNLDALDPDGDIVHLSFSVGGYLTLSVDFANNLFLEHAFAPITSLIPVSTGVWYFYRIWYDPTADTWNLQLDNGAIDSSAPLGWPQTAQLQLFNFCDDAGPRAILDETGLWKRVLSTTEASQLWNSGNGTTYPAVPP